MTEEDDSSKLSSELEKEVAMLTEFARTQHKEWDWHCRDREVENVVLGKHFLFSKHISLCQQYYGSCPLKHVSHALDFQGLFTYPDKELEDDEHPHDLFLVRIRVGEGILLLEKFFAYEEVIKLDFQSLYFTLDVPLWPSLREFTEAYLSGYDSDASEEFGLHKKQYNEAFHNFSVMVVVMPRRSRSPCRLASAFVSPTISVSFPDFQCLNSGLNEEHLETKHEMEHHLVKNDTHDLNISFGTSRKSIVFMLLKAGEEE